MLLQKKDELHANKYLLSVPMDFHKRVAHLVCSARVTVLAHLVEFEVLECWSMNLSNRYCWIVA